MTIEGPMKMDYIINDYVFLENICNLNCHYCHIKKSPYERLNSELVIDGRRTNINDILIHTDNILRRFTTIINSPILKISGGEITIIPEIIDIIKKYSNIYEVIQILTNNYLVTPDFYDAINSLNNVHIQVSLDGHLFKMNRYRFLNEIQFNRSFQNLERLIKDYDIPLEINCVITDANCKYIKDYIEWLCKFNRIDLKLNLFPVNNYQKLLPSKEYISVLEDVILNYDNYSSILLPYIYMKELLNFMRRGKRQSNCLVPYAVIGTYDSGKLDICACSPDSPSIGNILNPYFEMSMVTSNYNSLYEDFKTSVPCYYSCINCYTHYEILSLFFKNLVSSDEMKSIPLYRGKRTLDQLDLIKSNIFFKHTS